MYSQLPSLDKSNMGLGFEIKDNVLPDDECKQSTVVTLEQKGQSSRAVVILLLF